MNKYFVDINPSTDGEFHEMYQQYCEKMPSLAYRIFIGSFKFCSEALKEAEDNYSFSVNGCKWCCTDCYRASDF